MEKERWGIVFIVNEYFHDIPRLSVEQDGYYFQFTDAHQVSLEKCNCTLTFEQYIIMHHKLSQLAVIRTTYYQIIVTL